MNQKGEVLVQGGPMNPKQEVYTKVRGHLLAQGKKSIGVDATCGSPSECRYRAKGGLKCAIGCLISDSEYSRAMERKGVKLLASSGLWKPPDGVPLPMLRDLQECHDSYGVEEWPDRLDCIAKKWVLE